MWVLIRNAIIAILRISEIDTGVFCPERNFWRFYSIPTRFPKITTCFSALLDVPSYPIDAEICKSPKLTKTELAKSQQGGG